MASKEKNDRHRMPAEEVQATGTNNKLVVAATDFGTTYSGGTVDVTVHEVLKDNNLKEPHKATGGNWDKKLVGNRRVATSANFIASKKKADRPRMQAEKVKETVSNTKLVAAIDFGTTYSGYAFSFQHEYETNPSETQKFGYLELLDEFENKKGMSDVDSTEKVTVRVPIGIKEILHSETVQQNLQKTYKDKVNMLGDKLRKDAELFRGFFKQVVGDIIAHTEDLMEFLPTSVKIIMMVGGFAESPVLINAVKKASGTRVKVIVSVEASLYVMKGAVLYGHRPSMITERVSRYTYAVAITVPFERGMHPENRKYTENGNELCDCAFDKHVKIGQIVKSREVQATEIYYPMSKSDTLIPMIVYWFTDANPRFVDETSCDCVGSYLVKREPKTTKQRCSPNKIGVL